MAVKKIAGKRAAKKTAGKKTVVGKKKSAAKKAATAKKSTAKKSAAKKSATKRTRMEMLRYGTIIKRKMTAQGGEKFKAINLRGIVLLDASGVVPMITPWIKYKPATTGRIVKSSPVASRMGDARIEAAVRAVVERRSGKG